MKRISKLLFSMLFIFLSISFINSNNEIENANPSIAFNIDKLSEYVQPFFPVANFKEKMSLAPLFTPNNAIDTYLYWIGRANTSIYIQNPYITKFNDSLAWPDASPIISALVQAKNNGVSDIRVQVNKDADSDNITGYLNNLGPTFQAKYMGTSTSNTDGGWVSTTHNKLLIIDGKVVIISSINFSENAFLNNRESGMVIVNQNVANAFDNVFQGDWLDGEVPSYPLFSYATTTNMKSITNMQKTASTSYTSPFDIPNKTFTGVYNVSVFANPDNADQFIFHYLESAKTSIYVSMYTISRPDFNNTLINLKKANPNLDIQVLISRDRVGSYEDRDTIQAVKSLVANFIPVYNSTSQLKYYHNKYWVIDGKEVFVYSGNWSPASVTASKSQYPSGEPNRDMGIAIHDAPDVADFFIHQVWQKDVSYASPWQTPSGVKQLTMENGDVVKGNITLNAIISNLPTAKFYYRWNNESFVEGTLVNNIFSMSCDTNTLTNGINTFQVKAVTSTSLEYLDSVNVTIANYPEYINWRVLITEVLANPSTTTDALGEYYQVTNSFPFEVLLDGWTTGTKDDSFNFPTNFMIPAYTSIVFARNADGFEQAFNVVADFNYSFSLTNTADYVFLKTNRGQFIDVVAYGMQAPDGSETLDPAPSGKSLLRSPLYIDTNTTKDFIESKPDPKSTVPHISLDSTSTKKVSFFIEPVLLVFITLGFIRFNKVKKRS